ncbi:MAG TPA: HEAT repeat domain-containing protein [Acidobacteriota bacterium]|jgi:HEAT repeat protein
MSFDTTAAPDERQDDAVDRCVGVIETGTTAEKYNILPEISVLRNRKFLQPLLRILKQGSRKEKEFAALALGTLERTETLDPLFQALLEDKTHAGTGTQSLQAALIVAMGEVGEDRAIPYLRKAMDFTFKRDNFLKKRQKMILSAAASIAQQGGQEAVEFLNEYLFCDDPAMRAHAVTELSVAYWHRPNQIPDDVLESFLKLTRDKYSEVRSAAVASLANLADLGCKKAEHYFDAAGKE